LERLLPGNPMGPAVGQPELAPTQRQERLLQGGPAEVGSTSTPSTGAARPQSPTDGSTRTAFATGGRSTSSTALIPRLRTKTSTPSYLAKSFRSLRGSASRQICSASVPAGNIGIWGMRTLRAHSSFMYCRSWSWPTGFEGKPGCSTYWSRSMLSYSTTERPSALKAQG